MFFLQKLFDMFGLSPFQGLFDRELMLRLDGVVGVPKASKTHSLQGIEPRHHVDINIWENYNDLTATSLEIMVSKGNHSQMALIQVSEIL